MPRKTKTNPDSPPVTGRETVRTPETQKKLCDAIELGATYKLACQYAGISEATFYAWKADDIEFLETINRAEGKGAIAHLARIKQASTDGNWQASAWVLERRYPEEYGRRVIDANIKGELTIKSFADVVSEGDTHDDTNTDDSFS